MAQNEDAMVLDPNQASLALRTGGSIPLVGFGTWQMQGDVAYQAVRHALDVGYRHVDTATVYDNEDEVGRALADSGVPRDQIFLTTKIPPQRRGRVDETIETSLQRLGTDYVDLWLIHWPRRSKDALSMWRDMIRVGEGKARALGVSNFDIRQIDELTADSGHVPAVDQIPWSPFHRDPNLAERLSRRGVVLEGYSPLRSSRLAHPVLGAIAGRHGVSPAQVVLRWHVQHGVVVIPKSARPERIAENFDLFGFMLADAEMAQLDAL
jgi:diketogulonate reductase-like aldo/keto reductase